MLFTAVFEILIIAFFPCFRQYYNTIAALFEKREILSLEE